MEAIWEDVRFGYRMLMKHRLVSLVCIVALALGIGANAAIFSLAEAFLVHPVPFENADRQVMIASRHAQGSGGGFGPQDYIGSTNSPLTPGMK
jgi:putative ABC transport system permease protein